MEKEDIESTEDLPELEDIDDLEDGVWDDSDEEAYSLTEQAAVKCLYCSSELPSIAEVFKHCQLAHNFNILHLNNVHQFDCFGYIKLVNFIRRKQPSAEELLQLAPGMCPWNNDDYMKPEIEDDPLLQFDIEELSDMMEHISGDGSCKESTNEGCSSGMVLAGQETAELTKAQHSALLKRLCQAEERSKHAEEQLNRALSDMSRLKLAAKELVLTGGAEPAPSHQAIQSLKPGDDGAYVDSYSHFSIHQEMLQDTVRTESYRDAICLNPEVFRDKVVLDVGCGTGILSMFAARTGASHVIGVDLSDVIYQAMDIVRENGLQDKITLIKGRMEDVNLPVEKVDVIVSEWMGYCLLFESMLDSVLWARDRYLTDRGRLLPDRCRLAVGALADDRLHARHVGYWDDVYGFRMTCMRCLVVKEASVAVVDAAKLATDTCVFKEYDINTCSVKDLEFTSPFQLVATSASTLTALVVYFDIDFNLPQKVHFSTGPQHTPTHWKQTVFLLENPVEVTQGQVLDGQFILRKNPKDPRSCKITLSLQGSTTTYLLY